MILPLNRCCILRPEAAVAATAPRSPTRDASGRQTCRCPPVGGGGFGDSRGSPLILSCCGRLFVEGRFIGYKRSKVKQRTQWALLNIDGVASKEEAVWYQGKYAAYVYKALTKKGKEKMTKRVIWGKVCRPHGNKGVVRARFKKNLPSQAMGKKIRVMLYPSNI
eukprot:evm.model.scf_1246.6 EVM.evm.TU.scf_1246.6   scf_1246:33774-35161(+)